MFVLIVFKIIFNKTIIEFFLLDSVFVISGIHPNEGLASELYEKCYQPWPSAQLLTLTLSLIIPDKLSQKAHLIIVYLLFRHGRICFTTSHQFLEELE